MKILNQMSNYVSLSDLDHGECFSADSELYMKIDASSVIMKNGPQLNSSSGSNIPVLRLQSGVVCMMNSGANLKRVHAAIHYDDLR